MVANGDINTPEQAKSVLEYTGADAVMIGRAAQGQPWLFGQTAEYLATDTHLAAPNILTRAKMIVDHLKSIHQFYGDLLGVRLARKHIKWYFQHWETTISEQSRQAINATQDPAIQIALVEDFLFNSATKLVA